MFWERMTMRAEDKILGRQQKTEKAETAATDYFTRENVWKVEKKDCGTSEFDGVMVHEMLDAAGKKAVRSGTKELEYNGFKFKLVR